MIHLDTSYVVDVLREAGRGDEGPATRHLEAALADEELAVSVHVVCELFAGVELSSRRRRERRRVEELCSHLQIVYPDQDFASTYGRLLADTRRRGQPVATMDLLVATSAILHDSPLVTRDTGDFLRIPGLDVMTYG